MQALFEVLNLFVEGQAEFVVVLLGLGQHLLILLQTFLTRPELVELIHDQAHSLLHSIHLCPQRSYSRLRIIGTKVHFLTPGARALCVAVFVILSKLLKHQRLRS